jgi:nitroreductase
MTDVFSAINGRTSANNFDPTHVMTQAEITELAQLANQTPTSFNQQNWRLVAVNTPAAKARLKAAAYNQPKVGDAAVSAECKLTAHEIPVMLIAVGNPAPGNWPRKVRRAVNEVVSFSAD